MSEINETNQQQEQKQQGSNIVQKGQETAQNAKKIADAVKKADNVKKAAHSSKFLTAIGPILPYIGIALAIILLIMFIVGIVVFVLTMPGMVMEKLKAMFHELGNAVAAFFGADTTKQIEPKEVYEILDYLEDMGYDLKGYGFLTEFYDDDDAGSDFWEKAESEFSDIGKADNGVIRGKETDKIIGASSDFIYTYIMSDNYVYTVKNYNVINDAANEGGFWNTLWGGIVALGQKIASIVVDEGAKWGKGMIYLEASDGSEWQNNLTETVKVDPATKTLRVKRGIGANAFDFKLDGWTGRYGMPVDFLLAVHLATNMPDLAYDMVSMFGTEIVIRLADADAEIDAAYMCNDGTMLGYEDFDEIKGEGWWLTDGWQFSNEEAFKVLALGVDSPSECIGFKENDILNKVVSDYVGEYASYSDSFPDYKEEEYQEIVNAYNIAMEPLRNNGYTGGDLPASVSTVDEIIEALPDDYDRGYNGLIGSDYASRIDYGTMELVYKCLDKTISWVGTYEGEQCVYSASVAFTYANYIEIAVVDYDEDHNPVTKKFNDEHFNFIHYGVNRTVTESERADALDKAKEGLKEDGKTDEELAAMTDDEILGITKCSIAAQQGLADVTKCCDICKEHVANIMDKLGEAYDKDLDTFLPYIRYVEDHWYRDVYFQVKGKKDVIILDEEYEMLMNERWTLYETDSETGEQLWYEINSDGTLSDTPYEGTREEAEKAGIKLARKAKIQNIDIDVYEDKDGKSVGSWELAFPEPEDEIEKNVYVQVTTLGGKEQVEDGFRGVTNPKIKRIFATNHYFKYDGNADTAEVIYQLRRAVGSEESPHYGNLNGDDGDTAGTTETLDTNLEKSVSFAVREGDEDSETKEYFVKDYASQVDLTKDSLSAFSMLENTHTEDADYIYKDFKELIVELGYFDKEDLSENVPRIFQWFIPDIGSYGYPIRVVDKKENAFGTMAHSYNDYKAYEERSIAAAREKMAAEEAKVGDGAFEETATAPTNTPVTDLSEEGVDGGALDGSTPALEPTSGLMSVSNANTSTMRAIQLDNVSTANTTLVRGTNIERISEEGDGYHYKVKVGNVTYTHFYQFEGSYKDNPFVVGYDEGEANTIHTEGCGPTSSCNLLTGYGHDITPADTAGFLKSLGSNANLVKIWENWGVGAEWIDGKSEAEYLALMQQAVSEGKPFIMLMSADKGGDTFWTTGGHFVGVVGVDTSGNMITVDSGSSNPERHTYTKGLEGASKYMTGILIPDEAPSGVPTGDPYEGYRGGEAVVSPATGVLVEYGKYAAVSTTDVAAVAESNRLTNVGVPVSETLADPNVSAKDDVVTTSSNDSKFEEKGQRLNYDLMYPASGLTGDSMAENAGVEKIEPREVYEQVGYAKILVLDTEYYKKLEEHFDTTIEDNSTFLNEDNEFINIAKLEVEDLKSWTEEQITLYGYKEFAERYHAFNLGGYMITIDGFECELPNPDYNPAEGTGDPKGTALSMEYFKEHADDYEDSLYEKDPTYQLSSIETTARVIAETETKVNAKPIVVLGDGTVIIKEGTVIGRTRTDEEVATARGDEYTKPEEATTDGEEKPKEVIGNYIRIILEDNKEHIVENVEDYLKLDDGAPQMQDLDMEKFLYWMGIYVEGGVLDSTGTMSVAKVLGEGDNHYTHFFGLTECCADLYAELGYGSWSTAAGQTLPLENLANTFIALIEEQKSQVKSELGEDINDGYLQAFISVLHNYGNLTQTRKSEYLAKKCVSETTWTTYNGRFAEALRKRRKSEWKIISEGRYTKCYEDPEIDLEFSSETPFTDWCKEHGITNLTLKTAD